MRIPALLLASALLLTACAESPEPNATATASSTTTATAQPGDLANYTVTGDRGAEPAVVIAADAGNVTQLLVQDIYEGDGAEVQATDDVTVHYVGVGAMSRQVFDSSWAAGMTASFPLNGVIVGWQQGLLGMKVGGRRLLVIPADQAYGESGTPDGSIAPGETLIFVVDLVSIP